MRGLGARLVLDDKENFKRTYGNLLSILNTGVNTIVVHTLLQFYDPLLRCFTFQYYQLPPTLDECLHILGIEIQDEVLFVRAKEIPKSQHLAEVLHMGKKEVELNLKPKGGTHGFSLKFLVDKVITFAEAESWSAFNTVFSYITYGIVLFSNMEDFVDLASIYLFMDKNLVPTLLVYTYYSIHVRNQKRKGTIMCCILLLYRWFILHLSSNGPFVDNKRNLKQSQRIMSLITEDISWYSKSYEHQDQPELW
ncbi:uncharacterized protein LOC127095851 [Lathyrus oleraceus]|uniref:uncharacterized protein LOC127095851 n=1 Tax=Pisum sativum TaxID=3888 RepID=UPI0021D0B5F9|nr:uncharacterized protein LOC127095851 [Pisum sativum]